VAKAAVQRAAWRGLLQKAAKLFFSLGQTCFQNRDGGLKRRVGHEVALKSLLQPIRTLKSPGYQ
jgi:hypothetical protein